MTRDELFELCIYIAASAAELRNEPRVYGPLRLLEVLRRVSKHAAEESGDAFLRDAAAMAESAKALQIEGSEAFYDFLDRMVLSFVKEHARRNAASGKEEE